MEFYLSAFNVPADQVVAAWGADTKVLEFTSTTGNKLNLTERAVIKAGTPYFIQPGHVSNDHTYTSPISKLLHGIVAERFLL